MPATPPQTISQCQNILAGNEAGSIDTRCQNMNPMGREVPLLPKQPSGILTVRNQRACRSKYQPGHPAQLSAGENSALASSGFKIDFLAMHEAEIGPAKNGSEEQGDPPFRETPPTVDFFDVLLQGKGSNPPYKLEIMADARPLEEAKTA
jgi:hypothetical protein